MHLLVIVLKEDNSHALQLIGFARYLLGVPKPYSCEPTCVDLYLRPTKAYTSTLRQQSIVAVQSQTSVPPELPLLLITLHSWLETNSRCSFAATRQLQRNLAADWPRWSRQRMSLTFQLQSASYRQHQLQQTTVVVRNLEQNSAVMTASSSSAPRC